MDAQVDAHSNEWDVIVIGGAPPGENVAQYATQGSELTAVIVEKELVGGECSYWACMPSKALLRPVELLEEASHLKALANALAGGIDVDAALARRDDVVNHHDDAHQIEWARDNHIDVVRGHGRLAGERRVEVTAPDGSTRLLTARHAVVLDSGSRAAIPGVPGLAEARPWISRDVTNCHVIPRRVLVLGGGVVACESSTWLRGLGAEQVVLVEQGDALLARNEPVASRIVAEQLAAAGVDIRLRTTVTSVSRPSLNDAGEGELHGGEVTATLSDGTTVVVDEVVVAAGRRPNSDDIGLETVGLTPGGPVKVDDHFTVLGASGLWLYAIGDVCGRAQLTHMGKYQARLCGEVIARRASGGELDDGEYSRHRDLADHGAVPQVTFTSPPVCSVGRSEAEARGDGFNVETVEYDLAKLAGTYLLGDDYVGAAKLVIDADRDVLLGATFVGAGTAELVHSATVAIVGEVSLAALWHCVPSYPTVSEGWLRLLEALDAQRRERPRGA